jgi:hypothetical protein
MNEEVDTNKRLVLDCMEVGQIDKNGDFEIFMIEEESNYHMYRFLSIDEAKKLISSLQVQIGNNSCQ